MKNPTFFPLSESAVLLDFGPEVTIEKNKHILKAAAALQKWPFPGFLETVPAYTTLTVYYDPFALPVPSPYQEACRKIEAGLEKLDDLELTGKTVEIPVCYHADFALDMEEVAGNSNLSVEEVIERHTSPAYYVYFLGFTPGFPFLGGMDTSLAIPRKSSPRKQIAAGSVGIAGQQTGIYPVTSPGGWQIIGRTPISLLRLGEKPPTLLQAGDYVRFYAISKQAFLSWEESS